MSQEPSKSKKNKIESEIKSSEKSRAMIQDIKKLRLAEEITREQIHTLQSIEGFLTEYLEDFIVLGHSINGQRVNITFAKTPKDMDSLEQFYTDNLIFLKNKKYKDVN